jgi:nitrite reductase/ring-hydroxylating ferredoxin subunit
MSPPVPEREVYVGRFDDLADPDSIEFRIGDGAWPFKGFVVRLGDKVLAYQNVCPHAGHPLNWKPDSFLTPGGDAIICASHGAMFEIASGKCIAGPCPGRHLTAVPVAIRDGRIYVTGPDSLTR